MESMSQSEYTASEPLSRYLSLVDAGDCNYDAEQEKAMQALNRLYGELMASRRPTSVFEKVFSFGKKKYWQPVRGLYFWGGVGRGKTWLMDIFYDALPFEEKQRIHFHRFMRNIHRELTALKGQADPLQVIAANLAKNCRVICFDEFFVSDITDAMLLAGLFESLFAHGVCLVATSNIEPDGLYRDGLQRARFLPAIALIKQHTRVMNLDGGIDYRLRTLEQAELYHSPLDAAAQSSLMKSFTRLAPDDHYLSNTVIDIEGRELAVKHISDDVAWFDFYTLCDGPRSQHDYIELAKEFHAILISDVPQMDENNEDMARRFIHLIDEFYDRKIKLVISAEVPLEHLYAGGRLAFEFERTQSRLWEMQSRDYLAAAHKG